MRKLINLIALLIMASSVTWAQDKKSFTLEDLMPGGNNYYNRQGAKWPGAEPDNKKSSKSFSRLTAFAGRVGGGWYSVFMTCPDVYKRQL